MIIGTVKEVKPQERRVGLTPAGVRALVREGHTVFVEAGAGEGSGFYDEEYAQAGAVITNRQEVFSKAGMIVKVKEPQPEEYPLLRPGQILFTYLHLAPARELTLTLLRQHVTAIAYETIRDPEGRLPLLAPMSQIAGRMSVQIGAQFMEWFYGGRGVLLGGIPGVAPAHVAILGAGVVGSQAISVAVGMGARVTVFDVSLEKLAAVGQQYGNRVTTLVSTPEHIADVLQDVDLLISGVLVPGARAPRLVTEAMVKSMKPGSVIVDVAIDQGGSVETCDHTTTHADPVYLKHNVVHYSVANMPGAVPRTSTVALTNATLPYIQSIAQMSIDEILKSPGLAAGLNVYDGKLTNYEVAQALELDYAPLM